MAAKQPKKAARKGTKKTTKKATKRKPVKEEKWTWTDIFRTPLLASVGAFSIAEEGIENFVREIIERGEATEKEGRKIVDDFRKRAQKNRRDLEHGVDQRIERTLKSFRLPTKRDVDALEKKIEQLEKKVDRLTRKSGRTK
jgi:polyhydroxyalkanoate synthesis regulator phasin